jgi:hypothetical protein
MDRREFVKTAVAATAGAVAPGAAQAAAPLKKTIGIQVTVGPLVERGIEATLDSFEPAHVNTLFLCIFTYVPNRVGAANQKFHGGNYAVVHPQYYQGTSIHPEETRAPDFGTFDALAALQPAAAKRGMRTFCMILEDNVRPNITLGEVWERDLDGRVPPRHPAGPCLNNPNYRNFMLGLLEDYSRSYPIDGVMFGAERQGPLWNSLGAFHNGATSDPGRVTCFCEYCQAKAKRLGIDFERTRKGFRVLEQYVRDGRAGKRPTDGYFVGFWRILLNYPEVLAWEAQWTQSMREMYQAMYLHVKSVRPNVTVGWHIWHNTSFNPMFRAEQDFAELGKYSDFIKPVLYNALAGERMVSYMDSVGANVFGDVPKAELLELQYRILNYQEGPAAQIARDGLSADYVYRETKRTLDDLAGTRTEVWSGLDAGSRTGARDAVLASFRAGAQGVLLSRGFNAANLRGAGEAVEQLGFA